MRMSQGSLLFSFGCLLGLCGPAVSQVGNFVNDAEPDTPRSVRDAEYWREGQYRLPPWPQDKDLIEVQLDSPNPSFQYFIDGRHLVTGEDQVVRYTLVAKSRTGATNTSFEGLRCSPTGEHRVYAYGHQRAFEPTGAETDWQAIDRTGADPIRHELWAHYLCIPRKFAPRPTKDQRRLLESGRVNEYDNAGFLTE